MTLNLCSFLDEDERQLTEVFRDDIFTVVHDEDSPHVQLDVVLFLLVFEHVEWSSLGNEEKSSELKLSFHREVL